MLSFESYKSVSDIGRDLAERKIKLNPIGGSVIANLFSTSYVPKDFSIKTDNVSQEFQNRLLEIIEINNRSNKDLTSNIHNKVQS